MPEPIPYGRQLVEDDDVAAVVAALTSDFLTTGPEVAAFERDLELATGASHVVVVNSGTAALHAAYDALGVAGGEVVIPPLTFAATGNAALYLGARPVFADVDPATGLIDVDQATAAVTDRTRAIVAVDYTGLPADYDGLRRAVAGRPVPIVADAAHSLGAHDGGRPVGTLADATTLSFHPVKQITTGEGGAVATMDAGIRDRVATFRTHGITRDRARLRADEGPWHQEMQHLGFNYRLTDVQCALGRSQLRKLRRFVERRRAIDARYDEALGPVQSLAIPGRREGAESSWHLYVLRVARADRRRTFFERLRAAGLGVQVHYPMVYDHPFYRDLGYRAGSCPVAEDYSRRAVSIPLFPAMTDADVDRVIETVTAASREVLD